MKNLILAAMIAAVVTPAQAELSGDHHVITNGTMILAMDAYCPEFEVTKEFALLYEQTLASKTEQEVLPAVTQGGAAFHELIATSPNDICRIFAAIVEGTMGDNDAGNEFLRNSLVLSE